VGVRERDLLAVASPLTALHVSSTQCKPCPSLPLQKDAMGVEEEERQLANVVLDHLKIVGEEQMVLY
jgi:hypothetical protein